MTKEIEETITTLVGYFDELASHKEQTERYSIDKGGNFLIIVFCYNIVR